MVLAERNVQMAFEFKLRVALGNGTTEQTVVVTANNANDAKRAAEGQTGGKAMGVSQVSSVKPKK
jgi:hypothetical protein